MIGSFHPWMIRLSWRNILPWVLGKSRRWREKSSVASFGNQTAATKMLETFKKLTLMECQAELHRFRNIYVWEAESNGNRNSSALAHFSCQLLSHFRGVWSFCTSILLMTVIHHRRCLALKMKYNCIFFRLIVRACLLIILLGWKKKRNVTKKNAFLRVHHNS